MWVMSYTQTRYRRQGPPSVAVGHTVTREHPLVTLARWNARDAAEAGGDSRITALTWYAPLSEAEQAELAAAGLNVTAVDVSAYVTE